jgi:trigger factor
MKTTQKNLDNSQVKLTVELDAGEAAAIITKVEKQFMREAQIPGFRKGKVPLELIRRQFSNALEEEAKKEMFREYYSQAVNAEKIEEVALADVTEINLTKEAGSFVATIDVKPEFKLPTYKGLKISSQDVTVTDEAVDNQIESLRKAFAKFEDAKEGDAAAKGDYIQIDYKGTVKGKSILELNPEAKIVAEGTGFWTQIEDGRFLPEILEAVEGMKIGETKEKVGAKFDKETAPEGLKGVKAEYTVTLKALRTRILPTDEELIKVRGEESLENMKAKMRETMEKAAVERESVRRENEAAEMLMKKVDFAVPQSMVRNAMDNYLSDLSQRAQLSGIGVEYFKENRDKIMKEAEEAAVKQVRLWYVIEAIAKAEDIKVEDKENGNLGKAVIDFILANAKN